MTQVVLIDCTDEKGLISKITNVLFKHGLNIVANWEFVDTINGLFFMRTEIEGHATKEQLVSDLLLILPKNANVRISSKERKKVIILATKEAHCLGDLLVRCWHGGIDADIQAVISNHNILQDLVERFDLPYHYVPNDNIDRPSHEAQISEIIDKYRPDYLILAKYMRILSSNFTGKYQNKIINIHHSFLPAFVGAKPYQQAFDRGVKIIGATAHFVNENLDEGPIICQQVIPVDHAYSPDDMARAGQDVEKVTLAQAIRMVLEDRVFVCGNRTVVFD